MSETAKLERILGVRLQSFQNIAQTGLAWSVALGGKPVE
jgi:hypothetical protein